jgi:GNAT superfamily N-acetyltransferase
MCWPTWPRVSWPGAPRKRSRRPRRRGTGPADEQALAPEEPALAEHVAAVTDFLVEPRWQRRGHGSRLLAATVDLWREDGFTSAVAWAYDADKAMQLFLASSGWEPDGAGRALDVDDMLVNQLRLHVGLDPNP